MLLTLATAAVSTATGTVTAGVPQAFKITVTDQLVVKATVTDTLIIRASVSDELVIKATGADSPG